MKIQSSQQGYCSQSFILMIPTHPIVFAWCRRQIGSDIFYEGIRLASLVLFRSKYKFQNPIPQNSRHVRAVQNLLDFLPAEAIKSVVVFTGHAEFKTEIPQGVYTLKSISKHISQQSEEVMSLNRVQFCVGLETARLAISKQTDIEHIESLQLRHGSW